MARGIGRLLSLSVVGLLLGSVASLLYALRVKRRTVSTGDADSDEVALSAIFDSFAFASSASSFRGGSVLCYYGGGLLDLRGATLDRAGAHLDLTAIFGGGQVLVPPSWRVESHVRGIFGGVGPSRPAAEPAADAPTLRLDGLALFGGWAISTEAPEGTDRWLATARARRARATK